MKRAKFFLVSLAAVVLAFSLSFAADEEKGKALFNDPAFAGGTAGKSCNSCHPNGKGLEKSGKKKTITIMGKKQKSLEDAVNFCIENALKGKPIDKKSEDMANIVAYIKSLGKKK